MAKLLRTLMPAPFPLPCLHFAICVLVELYKVLCIILHSNNNSKGNNNYLAHDVFLAIELPPSRGTWPNFTADQATATTSSSPLPFLMLHHHHHHYRLQVIVIVIITAPCHSFCLAWDSLIIYNNVRQTLILIYTLTMLMSAFALASAPPSSTLLHSAFCCVFSCYLQRAWAGSNSNSNRGSAVNLLPQWLLCSTLAGQRDVYVIIE